MQDNEGYALRVCVLFALREESGPFLSRRRSFGWVISTGVSGSGIANARKHAAMLMDDPGPKVKCLIVCGFAGALAPDLAPGSIVIASQAAALGADLLKPDSVLLKAAESVRIQDATVQCGPIVTTDRVLVKAREKREMFDQTSAIAVDMETYGAASEADVRGIPWAAIRTVTDGQADDLPLDFNLLTRPDGAPDLPRIICATVARPWIIPAMIKLGKRSSLAAENLARFLESFLQALPD